MRKNKVLLTGGSDKEQGGSNQAPNKHSLIAHAKNLNKQGAKAIADLGAFATAEQTQKATDALAVLESVLAEVEAAA